MDTCGALSVTRDKIINQMTHILKESRLYIDIRKLSFDKLTQFGIDPSSLNLEKRVSLEHPCLPKLFQISRDFCYFIDKSRTKIASLK